MPAIRRFPVLFQFASTEEHERAFNALAQNTLFSKSQLYRMAFDEFLRQHGVLAAPQARPNGQHAQAG